MTRKLIIFLVCCVIAVSSFIVPAGASYDFETESTPEYIASNEEDYGISLMTVSSPNFTYDISKIDWYTDTPQQVRDVFEMAVSAAPTESTLQPFVAVFVISNTSALVLAGINVGGVVRVNTSNSSLNRFGLCYFGTVSPFTSHYLYQATFNANGERTGNWNQLAASDWGSVSSGRCMYYGGWIQPDYVRDVYVWGANGVSYHTNYTSLTVYDGTDSVYQFYTRFNATSGGYNGSLIPSAYSSAFPNVYESTLTVPSFEQWQAARQEAQHEETGSWISKLGDRISEFFSTLKNWLLWFNAEGSESYENPFSNILSDIQNFFDEQVSDTTDFKNSLTETLDRVVGYISSGSGFISTVLTGVPILSAFVAFFVVFSVIRKVVGR